jgi:LacI family transcriptional regulator
MSVDRRPAASGRPTIKQVAQYLGVSHTTVSRALNDHPQTSKSTKERVRLAAHQLGYIRHGPAQDMRRARSSLIGLIVPDVQNYFYATAAKVLAASCAAQSLQLVLAVSEDDPQLEYRHAMALREAQVAGIIVVPTARPDRRTIALLDGSLTVQFVRTSPRIRGGAVVIDDALGTHQATAHLLRCGHTRLAFIGGPRSLSTGVSRLDGFERAVREAGLAPEAMAVELGPPRPAFGQEACARILQRNPRPSGIVLGSSELTLGALATLQAARLTIPKDLSLVAYGDPDWFRLWGPGITTVGLPVEQMSEIIADLLFRMIGVSRPGREPLPARTAIDPRLIVRGTTARWRG